MTEEWEPSRADPTGDADEGGTQPLETPSPRAFAIGTGVWCQTVGMVLLLGGCCLWGLSDRITTRASEPAPQWTDFLFNESFPAAIWTLGLATTFVGGLALVAVGVGLQGERAGSGRVAMVVTALMTLIYLALAVALAAGAESWYAALAPGLLAVVTGVLFLLSGNSAATLRRFPPPPDQSKATAEFLEEHRRRREERLKEYDS